MSFSGVVKIAPILTESVLRNHSSQRAGKTFYQRGALTLKAGAPLVIDHDMGRPVGVVNELVEFVETDGPWLCARCTITDPPSWLRRGTKASFAFYELQQQAVGDWERVLRGLVSEVSILSAARRPKEPRAEVTLLYRSKPSPAVRASASSAFAGEVFTGGGQPLLIRPGIGQILALR